MESTGAHISVLLLRFFILYMPFLIEDGRVYKAMPPLYSIGSGKKITYFTNQIDMIRCNQKNFIKVHEVRYPGKNGQVLSGKELTVLFLTNRDYLYELNRLSTTYAMKPELLEMVLLNYYNNKSSAALKKQVKSAYRFMDVTKKNGITVVEGTIDKSYKLYMNDRLINDCQTILDIIKDNKSCYYILDGKESSLYEVMTAYEKCMPTNLQRYKGLGEMNVEDITQSTMSPYGARTLVQYTIDDVKEELEAIRDYESGKGGLSKLLDLISRVDREDLMD